MAACSYRGNNATWTTAVLSVISNVHRWMMSKGNCGVAQVPREGVRQATAGSTEVKSFLSWISWHSMGTAPWPQTVASLNFAIVGNLWTDGTYIVQSATVRHFLHPPRLPAVDSNCLPCGLVGWDQKRTKWEWAVWPKTPLELVRQYLAAPPRCKLLALQTPRCKLLAVNSSLQTSRRNEQRSFPQRSHVPYPRTDTSDVHRQARNVVFCRKTLELSSQLLTCQNTTRPHSSHIYGRGVLVEQAATSPQARKLIYWHPSHKGIDYFPFPLQGILRLRDTATVWWGHSGSRDLSKPRSSPLIGAGGVSKGPRPPWSPPASFSPETG